MNIKVLGSGCQNCKRLYENAKEAVHALKIEAERLIMSLILWRFQNTI